MGAGVCHIEKPVGVFDRNGTGMNACGHRIDQCQGTMIRMDLMRRDAVGIGIDRVDKFSCAIERVCGCVRVAGSGTRSGV